MSNYQSKYTGEQIDSFVGFTTCSSSGTALTASIDNYSLVDGACTSIKFTNAVQAGATLSISGKGAKPLYYKGSPVIAGVIKAGDLVTLVYAENKYYIVGSGASGSTARASVIAGNNYKLEL